MPKLAANLSLMFNEWEPRERFEAARAAGFRAVEYLRPYEFSVADVRDWLLKSGLELCLINAPSGNAEAGERGLAALPGRQEDFSDSFDLALEYATGLGAKAVHVLAGTVPAGTP